MCLKQYYGFVLDIDVVVVYNSGQGNVGWLVLVILEGISWEVQLGNYYCMSWNWVENDCLMFDVWGNSKESFIIVIYIFFNLEYFKKIWILCLWKQILDVVSGFFK